MKKRILIIFTLISVLALMTACSSQNQLADTNWQLTQLGGNPVLPDVKVTLNLSKDAIGGNDGCNTYGGSYKSAKEKLTIGEDVFSTMMYCTDEIAKQSNAYYDALKQTATYTLSDDTFSLMDKQGNVLAEFSAIKK